jgi:hypothetical protein
MAPGARQNDDPLGLFRELNHVTIFHDAGDLS